MGCIPTIRSPFPLSAIHPVVLATFLLHDRVGQHSLADVTLARHLCCAAKARIVCKRVDLSVWTRVHRFRSCRQVLCIQTRFVPVSYLLLVWNAAETLQRELIAASFLVAAFPTCNASTWVCFHVGVFCRTPTHKRAFPPSPPPARCKMRDSVLKVVAGAMQSNPLIITQVSLRRADQPSH
jgi:hypothetical protein